MQWIWVSFATQTLSTMKAMNVILSAGRGGVSNMQCPFHRLYVLKYIIQVFFNILHYIFNCVCVWRGWGYQSLFHNSEFWAILRCPVSRPLARIGLKGCPFSETRCPTFPRSIMIFTGVCVARHDIWPNMAIYSILYGYIDQIWLYIWYVAI